MRVLPSPLSGQAGRGSLAPRMPPAWAGALCVWRAVFLSYLIAPVGASENFDLQCYTDFATEVVCHWDAEGAIDCAKTFRVTVHSNASLMNGMKETDFAGTEFTFSLETGTKKSKNKMFDLDNIVKPRPPVNLTVTKSNKRSFVLNWTKDYGPDSHIRNIKVLHQVRMSSKGSEQPELRNMTEQAEHYEIFAQALLPGENYTVWVRYRLADWGGYWSEWSSPATLINNFKPEPGDTLWQLILLICFLVLVLIPASFFCWVRLKREWWDQVPSPAKSKLAKDLGKKPWPMLQGGQGKVPFCAASENLLGKQRGFTGSLLKDGATFPSRLDKAAVRVPTCLIPEAPPVESPLTICSREAAAGPGAPMEEEEEHTPRHDALTDLFLDILGSGGSAEDTEAPDSALGESPPASAPKLELGDLCLFGGTPQKNPSGSSTSGYQNSVVSASSQAASPALEQLQGGGPPFSPSQYKSLVFPQQLSSTPYPVAVTDGDGPQGSSGAPASQPSCYKSFSSLVGLPTASVHPPWKHQLDFPGVDQAQALGRWPPSCVEGLFSPPQQEALSQNAPDIPCLPGYQPFRVGLLPSAISQDPGCLSSGSPQGVFQGIPDPILRTWEAETEAWPGASWEEPLAFDLSPCMEEEEQDSCQGGFRQGTEGFLPQVPVEPF